MKINQHTYRKAILFCMVVFSVFNLSAQLEFTQADRWLFLGADSIEGKKIIAGVYVIPQDSYHLKLDIAVADDWVTKDTLDEFVTIDKRSIRKNKYFITMDSVAHPAYRFANKSGLEILIAKEETFESYDSKGVCTKSWHLSYAQIYLPKKRKSYVRSLPLMFEK